MILFYSENSPYFEFSNFYQPKIPFTFNNIKWANTEAYFQAQKWSSPNNDKESVLKYQQLISSCNTPNKAFILGKAQFVHGLKNKWTINANKMTLNEAIALYTTTEINPDWENAEQLINYRKNAVKPITFDSIWWEEHKLDYMIDIIWEKFNSIDHPELKALLLSTTDEIREHTTRDLFWADGGDLGGGKNMLGQILVLTRNKLNQINYNININYIAPPQNVGGSYVKLSDTLYYGIHPSIIYPDIKIDNFIGLVEEHEFEDKYDITFPIKDRKAPTLDYLTKIVHYILTLKGTIYIFCRGGHGRSGTIAAAVYGKINQLSGKQALKHINKEWHNQRNMSYIRPRIIKLGSPQTACQKQIVKKYLD